VGYLYKIPLAGWGTTIIKVFYPIADAKGCGIPKKGFGSGRIALKK